MEPRTLAMTTAAANPTSETLTPLEKCQRSASVTFAKLQANVAAHIKTLNDPSSAQPHDRYDRGPETLAILVRIQDARERLGQPSGTGDVINFDRKTTVAAVRRFKALVAELLPQGGFRRTIAEQQTELCADIKWKFMDVFDMVDFLSCLGKDGLFNKQRHCMLNIQEPIDENRDCCLLPTVWSETRCPHNAGACIVCPKPPTMYAGTESGDWHNTLHPDSILPPSTLLSTNPPSIPSILNTNDDYETLSRTACPHAQRNRFFTLLAARLLRMGFDPSDLSSVSRLRWNLMNKWIAIQRSKGWEVGPGLSNFPPNDRNYAVMLQCDEGQELSFRMYLTRHEKHEGVRVLTYCFFGQLELLI